MCCGSGDSAGPARCTGCTGCARCCCGAGCRCCSGEGPGYPDRGSRSSGLGRPASHRVALAPRQSAPRGKAGGHSARFLRSPAFTAVQGPRCDCGRGLRLARRGLHGQLVWWWWWQLLGDPDDIRSRASWRSVRPSRTWRAFLRALWLCAEPRRGAALQREACAVSGRRASRVVGQFGIGREGDGSSSSNVAGKKVEGLASTAGGSSTSRYGQVCARRSLGEARSRAPGQ